MQLDEYFEWWMQNVYPHAKYVNCLSHKWVKQFAQDYKNVKANSGLKEQKLMENLYKNDS